MYTGKITPDLLAGSVIAVPPLARDRKLRISAGANRTLIRHIEAGGVTTLLYGGNANLYNVALSEYAGLLDMLARTAAKNTWIIPSAGPSFGMMMDQAKILRQYRFPTAMVLPPAFAFTQAGVATAFRKFVEAYGRPAVLYIKNDGVIEVDQVRRLVKDGLVSWIKYAIVRKQPEKDPYLAQLVKSVDPDYIVSGIGEQPALVHMKKFGLIGYTAGCVCVAPWPSAQMLDLAHAGLWKSADRLRSMFRPLEDLRNGISPIRVLHEAVSATVADMGPQYPLLSDLEPARKKKIAAAARALLKKNCDH